FSKASAARKKAELHANLHLLNEKKEAAAAEALALENFEVNNSDMQRSLFETADNLSLIDPAQRTSEYVKQQIEFNAHQSHFSPMVKVEDNHIEIAHNPTRPDPFIQAHEPVVNGPVATQPSRPLIPPGLDASAPPFEPRGLLGPRGPTHGYQNPVPQEANVSVSQPVTSELTRFLLKKDLLLSRLSHFNDKPESFAVWKASFKNIMRELSVTPFEEMDLLVKWLGPDSSKHALSIRSSNADNPARGLQRIWDRMEERYGCPEMVESALKTKLASFPKLTNKDTKKLYDLSDILSEIEAAKENRNYQNLLAYFDSSSGVAPIVAKLPYQLQEKWTNRAVAYKKSNNVSYPPFPVFSSFIREMSKIKNDLGFDYERCSPIGREAPNKSNPSRPVITARKTGVEPFPNPVLGPDKVCPIHKTKHTLNACRAFKAKSLDERKKLLKEKNICFRCCMSDKHRARECKEQIQCSDCGSNSHSAALHVDSEVPKVVPSSSTTGHGGEPRSQATTEPKSLSVNCKCTQVCKDQFNGKSCAKTLLVRVYRTDRPDDVKAMYAIVDDQRTPTLPMIDYFGRQ
ncbi:MAG: hypothetical protein ABW092_05990, partial [Candidatus Thiodiazotropha sp.]